jgi:hypothetical protein
MRLTGLGTAYPPVQASAMADSRRSASGEPVFVIAVDIDRRSWQTTRAAPIRRRRPASYGGTDPFTCARQRSRKRALAGNLPL